jgi:uncharacterized membrane protein YjgN (DUF898 family)
MEPHRATTILVLGILGIALCYICGPIAWVMANKDIAKMNAGLMDPTGLEQTKAGKICGIIGTVFLILGTIFAVLYVIFAIVLVGAAAAQGGLPQ